MKALKLLIGSIAGISGLMVIANSAWADDGSHDFTDTRGRVVKGELVDFFPQEELATIRNQTGKAFPVPLAKLCNDDREYIREWGVTRDFNTKFQFTLALRTYKAPKAGYGKSCNPETIQCQGYGVELVNDSATPFADVEIEYCLFYRQGRQTGATTVYAEGIQYGRVKIGPVPSGSLQAVDTKPVFVQNEHGTQTLFGRTADGARGEVLGLWLRVYATLPTGERVSRDICSSDNLPKIREWTTHTLHVGLNRDSRLRAAVAQVD